MIEGIFAEDQVQRVNWLLEAASDVEGDAPQLEEALALLHENPWAIPVLAIEELSGGRGYIDGSAVEPGQRVILILGLGGEGPLRFVHTRLFDVDKQSPEAAIKRMIEGKQRGESISKLRQSIDQIDIEREMG